jgi:hypothetical protein
MKTPLIYLNFYSDILDVFGVNVKVFKHLTHHDWCPGIGIKANERQPGPVKYWTIPDLL